MAAERLHKDQNTSLVTYSIKINEDELSDAHKIMSLSVSKELNRIPTAKIVLLDGNAAKQDFPESNSEYFIPGNEIEIWAGYHSDEELIFKGIIIKHSLKIRSGQSYLIIECKDQAVKLTVGRKNQCFYESTDQDVFEELIKKHGLDQYVEATSVKHEELVQHNITDWDFIMMRAQAMGKVCLMDDGSITIKNPDTEQQSLGRVSYGDDLYEMDAEMDARNQFDKITSYGWNPADQELLEVEASASELNLNGNLTSGELATTIGLENLELRNGPGSTEILQNWVDAKAVLQQISKVRGRIKIQGSARIKPDRILDLGGVGDHFNGRIYISGLRHEIMEGNWFTHIQFGMDPAWFMETYAVNDMPASGLFPAVHGLQIGIVTQLEDDPEKEERIRVSLPAIEKGSKGIWARLATLDAGENRGSFFLPEIGDEVVLGFINANSQQAVVLGMLNSSMKPAPLTAADDNHEKGFVTRSGIRLIFNDEKKSTTIETPEGKKIIMDDDEGNVLIEDDKGNIFKMDGDGISLESQGNITLKANGDITVEGMNINQKANAQLKMEGSAGAEFSSSGFTAVKGSIVQIN